MLRMAIVYTSLVYVCESSRFAVRVGLTQAVIFRSLDNGARPSVPCILVCCWRAPSFPLFSEPWRWRTRLLAQPREGGVTRGRARGANASGLNISQYPTPAVSLRAAALDLDVPSWRSASKGACCNLGRSSASIANIGSNLCPNVPTWVDAGPTLFEYDQKVAQIERIWSMLVQRLAQISQLWPAPAMCWPMLASIDRHRHNLGRLCFRATFVHFMGRCETMVGQIQTSPNSFGVTFRELW